MLPYSIYSHSNTCAICLTKIERSTENSDAERVELHCRHSFHKKCSIVKWLEYKKIAPSAEVLFNYIVPVLLICF